jgi:hypothetical protein
MMFREFLHEWCIIKNLLTISQNLRSHTCIRDLLPIVCKYTLLLAANERHFPQFLTGLKSIVDVDKSTLANYVKGHGSWQTNEWKCPINAWECQPHVTGNFVVNVEVLILNGMPFHPLWWMYGRSMNINTVKNNDVFVKFV